MTDPIDAARQEGIALGLAMAARELSECELTEEEMARLGDWAKDWLGLSQNEAAAILALAPIPPHVAAARVLLDMPPNSDGMHVLPDHMRAALEQIAND
jgi:hypothetical protein